MTKPMKSVNPFESHSYSVPRNMYRCLKPGCQFVVEPHQMMCELHSASTLPAPDRQDDDE